MSPIVLLAAAIIVPVVVLTLSRVNATVVFLSLCLGSVLVQFMGTDAISAITTFFPHAGNLSESSVEIILLLIPASLTTIFMIHSVRKVKVVLNVLPALTVGLLLIILLEPLLSPGLQGTITHSNIWQQFTKAQTLIVGAAALINLALLWMERRGHAGKERKGKHS